MMRALVTGGAGFIGSHLVERLLNEGMSVRVLDNFDSGRRANLNGHVSDIELIRGDLRDLECVRRAASGMDAILHQAAVKSVPRSVDDPLLAHTTNTNGTFNVLLAARDAGVPRVVYASSSSVYGSTEVLPKREDLLLRPSSPYGASKLAGELYCHAFFRVYGLETIALRYFNVFGPRQDSTSTYAAAIPRFIEALRRGEPPTIYGDGHQSRDFTHIDNVVDANLSALKASSGFGEAFNVACGQSISILELVGHLREILRVDIKPLYESDRPGDIRHSLADISKARKVLGYRPTVDLAEGLRRTVAWYLRERDA